MLTQVSQFKRLYVHAHPMLEPFCCRCVPQIDCGIQLFATNKTRGKHMLDKMANLGACTFV